MKTLKLIELQKFSMALNGYFGAFKREYTIELFEYLINNPATCFCILKDTERMLIIRAADFYFELPLEFEKLPEQYKLFFTLREIEYDQTFAQAQEYLAQSLKTLPIQTIEMIYNLLPHNSNNAYTAFSRIAEKSDDIYIFYAWGDMHYGVRFNGKLYLIDQELLSVIYRKMFANTAKNVVINILPARLPEYENLLIEKIDTNLIRNPDGAALVLGNVTAQNFVGRDSIIYRQNK